MAANAISPVETSIAGSFVAPVVPIGTTVAISQSPKVELADAITEPDWSDKLSKQICGLWSSYRKNRIALGSALHTQKELLKAKEYGQWAGFLQHAGIPRSSAERLIAGFIKYMGLRPEIRELAKTQGVDIAKPSVLSAIQQEDISFDVAACSQQEKDKFIAHLKEVQKPRKVAKKAPVSSSSADSCEHMKKLAKVKSCIVDYLASFKEAAQRTEEADSLCEWIEEEFLPNSVTNGSPKP